MSKEFPYHQARKKSSSTRIWIKCDMPLEKVTIVCHSHEILISLGIIIWMIHANLSKIKIASAKFTANVLFTKVALKLSRDFHWHSSTKFSVAILTPITRDYIRNSWIEDAQRQNGLFYLLCALNGNFLSCCWFLKSRNITKKLSPNFSLKIKI